MRLGFLDGVLTTIKLALERRSQPFCQCPDRRPLPYLPATDIFSRPARSGCFRSTAEVSEGRSRLPFWSGSRSSLRKSKAALLFSATGSTSSEERRPAPLSRVLWRSAFERPMCASFIKHWGPGYFAARSGGLPASCRNSIGKTLFQNLTPYLGTGRLTRIIFVPAWALSPNGSIPAAAGSSQTIRNPSIGTRLPITHSWVIEIID